MWVSRRDWDDMRKRLEHVERMVRTADDRLLMVTDSDGLPRPWGYRDHPLEAHINYVVAAIAKHLGMSLKKCKSEWTFDEPGAM
jgi:hypothetical protein